MQQVGQHPNNLHGIQSGSVPFHETFEKDTITENVDMLTPLSPQPVIIEQEHSFDSIISGESQAPFSRVAFATFLQKIHCSENLDFLINSNQFLLSNDEDTLSKSQLWNYIYTTFISTDSPKEVNIPHDLKEELSIHYDNDSIPSNEIISKTVSSIKDLLRDGYLQFIQSVKRQHQEELFSSPQPEPTHYFHSHDKVNENYSLLPTPTDEFGQTSSPSVRMGLFTENKHTNRRLSETCSPLDGASTNSRCVSPLSDHEILKTNHHLSPNDKHGESHTSLGVLQETTSTTLTSNSSEESIFKYSTHKSSTGSKSTKSSFSEASTGLKKIAGKFRWRRLSSNSSAGSNN